jgi:Zn-dependent protease
MPGCCVQRWSLSLGRWWGARVYLHIFFILFALLPLTFTFTDPDLMWSGLLAVGILLVSVALHELAHALAALRVGGRVDAIVLGPVGGLMSPRVPDEPEVHLFVALAGPIVHLLLAVIAAGVLALVGSTEHVGLLNPLATPRDLIEPGGMGQIAAKLALWLNWILMLLNLLPVYPFDGGPILRAMLWPAFGRRTARAVTARVAMVAAVLLCAASLLTLANELPSSFPMWIPLVTLGVFVFFSARQDLAAADSQDWADTHAGYQVNSDGLDLLDTMWLSEDEEEGVLVEHHQRPQPEQYDGSQDASEDARVDDILARLYDSSWDALSAEEIAVLQRASQRYRRRRQSADRA